MKLIIILLLIFPFLILPGRNKKTTLQITYNRSDTTTAWNVPESADKLKNPLAGVKEATQKGKDLFTENCITCHGMTGLGDGPTADLLDTKPANLTSSNIQKQSDGVLFWKISTGKGAMVSYKQIFSEEQRWQLVNYIRQLGNQKAIQKK